MGSAAIVAAAVFMEANRLLSFAGAVPQGQLLSFVDPATTIGALVCAGVGLFGLRVAIRGNSAFSSGTPRRVAGSRAIHGDSDWMSVAEAAKLFPETGGIVIGERYRVDKDTRSDGAFRADDRESWGTGGQAKLLCFDCSFGSTHGVVFAGQGPGWSASARQVHHAFCGFG